MDAAKGVMFRCSQMILQSKTLQLDDIGFQRFQDIVDPVLRMDV